MTQRKIKHIDGGSLEYWRQRTEGFRLVREAERALVRVKNGPTYIAGSWDEDYGDYEPVENLGPYDDMDEAIRAIEANETAVDILVAQRRTHFGDWLVAAVIRACQRSELQTRGEQRLSSFSHGPDRLPASNLRAVLRGETLPPLPSNSPLPVVRVKPRPASRAGRRTLPRLPQTIRGG